MLDILYLIHYFFAAEEAGVDALDAEEALELAELAALDAGLADELAELAALEPPEAADAGLVADEVVTLPKSVPDFVGSWPAYVATKS